MSNRIENSGGLQVRVAFWATAGILIAAVIGVALFKAWPVLRPAVVARAALDPACDLRQGPCRVRLRDGREIGLEITPRGIPVVRPLRVIVLLQGIDARGVQVDFAGVDMNMGYNRVSLHEVRPGRYEGKAMLPVCVRHRMRWEAKVLVHSPGGALLGPFRFDTFRP